MRGHLPPAPRRGFRTSGSMPAYRPTRDLQRTMMLCYISVRGQAFLHLACLRSQLDILEVSIEAGDDPREHVLRDILRVHRCLRKEPEQRHVSELGELMVADLQQQSRPFPCLHDFA